MMEEELAAQKDIENAFENELNDPNVVAGMAARNIQEGMKLNDKLD